MAKSTNMLAGLTSHPNAIGEKDILDPEGLAYAFKSVKDAEQNLRVCKQELGAALGVEAKARGLEPAYVNTKDLIDIISSVLLTGCPISKAFQARELNAKLCAGWAERAINRRPDADRLNNAISCLDPQGKTQIQLMKDYAMLDIKEMIKAKSYREALNRMKKQLAITKELKKKDDKIEKLEAQIAISAGVNWKAKALLLIQQGMSVTAIAPQVGKGRTTVSNYLNEPSIKAQW